MNEVLTSTNIKGVWPQVLATLVSSSFSICFGSSIAYTAILIAQLKNEFKPITDDEASWISSIGSPLMVLTSGILILIVDAFGRLNSLRLMIAPFILGQILIATSTNLSMLLVGKALSIGVSVAFPIISSVYITEISLPSARGLLLSFKPVIISFAMLITYIQGKFFNWRIIAYIIGIYAIVVFLLSMLVPESVLWLSSKHRKSQAAKSAKWFGVPEVVDVRPNNSKLKLSSFQKPTFYKPIAFITGFYMFQELSGTNVIFINLITFFDDFGTKYDPFTISIYLSSAKFFMNMCNSWLMSRFGRRSLTMFSFLGMAIAITVSATFTMMVNKGGTSYQWVPPVMLIAYVVFLNCGVMFMPYLISSELCPGRIRGAAQSISFAISHVMTFIALQLYYLLKKHCTSWYIQYYFGAMALVGVFYSYVFMPETHNKTLTEIEDYFWSHSNYISAQTVKKNQEKNVLLKTNQFNC
ncbi:hypothetical protein RN001_010495 [Aquatica leii]|uniref:Major facilitator superfamily (MFS) profile domain-containing protein n=1 Tax=Aquatica leii TaxID=1421715 RepID=A0AAN7P6J7_9COLE|nr:hypothetical protein RN001_010495 [Aquatica leii]